jgi:hypothetical protein
VEPPDAFPDIEFEDVDNFLLEMQEHDKEIKAGVMIVGEPEDVYGPVWEWGNRRQKKSGPRTVIGTNPRGQMVWLSSQAPFGWIRINEPFMHRIVDDVLGELSFDQPDAASITREIERGAKKISKAIADVLKDSAPVDTGALRRSIVPVDPNDAILDQETDEFDALDLSGE